MATLPEADLGQVAIHRCWSRPAIGPDKRGAFDGSMQHHLGTDLFKGGDYDPTEEVEIISHGEERHMAPMEVRAVLARNRACSWQAASTIRKLLLPSGGIPPITRRRLAAGAHSG